MDEDVVSVLVVDDHPPFRRVAAAVVSATPGFAVMAEAHSGEEAVARATQRAPRLVLMDITMPGIGGIEATRRIVGDRPQICVVLLSTYAIADLPEDARSCGAVAYVHKEDFGPGVLEAVWANRAGGFATHPHQA